MVNRQALETDRLILASARSTEVGRRLMAVPGVGPVPASTIVASVPDPHALKSGRTLAAWIGLVPKQNSSGGKARLGGITKQGNLRQLLVVGALAVKTLVRSSGLPTARGRRRNSKTACATRMGSKSERRSASP